MRTNLRSTLLAAFLSALSTFCGASTSYSVSPAYESSIPPSVSAVISSASQYAPSITTIGTILSTIELSSPSLSYAESVIESYIYASQSIVSYLQSAYEYPSQVTSSTSFQSLVYDHSTLASAVSTLESIMATHPSLSRVQSTLESVMTQTDESSILSYLAEYSSLAYASVYQASQVIEQAALTDSSIVNNVLEVLTAVSSSSSVSTAISELASTLYTLPSTVASDVISVISSPNIVAPSVESYLASNYQSVYSKIKRITSYFSSNYISALTEYLSAAASVQSLGSAVSTVVYYQMPTLYMQESVLTSVSYSWHSMSTDLNYIGLLAATSVTLGNALSYIEGTFYSSPEIAESLYLALQSPSSVSDTERVAYEEMSHQSFISALSEVSSFEYAYSSYAKTLYNIMPYLTSAFQTARTLLTAYSYMNDALSPSLASATNGISSVLSYKTDATSVLSAVSYIDYESPSISDDEYIIQSYAYNYPLAAQYLWSVFQNPSQYSSDASYIADVEASYSALVSALHSVYEAEYSYPELYNYESTFLAMGSYDMSLTYQWENYSYDSQQDYENFWWK